MRHRLGAALVVALLLTALLCGCSSGAAPRQSVAEKATGDAGKGDTGLVAPVTEPLRDPAWPGIPLADALARAGRQVPLPQSTAGTISKVLFFPAPDGSADFWLSILYSSGVELHATTGQDDLDAFAKLVSTTEFRDGADHLVRETIGGRDVCIVRGGVQTGAADGHVVRPVAVWNESGLAYTLYLPVQQADDVQRLEAIVSSVATGG